MDFNPDRFQRALETSPLNPEEQRRQQIEYVAKMAAARAFGAPLPVQSSTPPDPAALPVPPPENPNNPTQAAFSRAIAGQLDRRAAAESGAANGTPAQPRGYTLAGRTATPISGRKFRMG